jgi:hypothetical protein
MSTYSETDFCTPDQGLDYIFGRMMAIFGATFNRHFDGIDAGFVRQEWKKQLGSFLTYRPSMDFAIEKLDGEFVPSAIKFRNLCNTGPAIPRKPVLAIEKQLTQKEKAEIERNKKIALAKLAELRRQYKGEA